VSIFTVVALAKSRHLEQKRRLPTRIAPFPGRTRPIQICPASMAAVVCEHVGLLAAAQLLALLVRASLQVHQFVESASYLVVRASQHDRATG
jgi:hypothetical protein